MDLSSFWSRCCGAKNEAQIARRVVTNEEHHGEMFAHVGFVVADLTLSSRLMLCFYNIRSNEVRLRIYWLVAVNAMRELRSEGWI